jgi:translation initiation factor eIF-2B subunit gamma
VEPLDNTLSISGRDLRALPCSETGRIHCAVVIEQAAGAVCVRANTLAAFLEVNIDVARSACVPWMHTAEVRGDVGGKTGFGHDCVRGDGVESGAQSTVKRSVVGSHCRIGAGVKLANCVVMDHVSIGDKVMLSNCIVCSNADVHEGASLTNCQVGSSFTVEAGAQHKNAVLSHDAGNEFA